MHIYILYSIPFIDRLGCICICRLYSLYFYIYLDFICNLSIYVVIIQIAHFNYLIHDDFDNFL